ncbi:hypothetical protein [Pelagibacterium montanilacus]|uniref:hypothetical protein n=1 Tax=Pelagibacterium montanilacus TaxID=2185280 RepID=UPI000F8CA8CA|nr:hypothetical protein [Pelagibacterium montanilacus]
MTKIDLNSRAALYLGSGWENAREQGARAFPTAAQAIRFAMEEAPPVSRRGALMVVDGRSCSGADIEDIYRSRAYPYPRKSHRRYRPSQIARRLQTMAG